MTSPCHPVPSPFSMPTPNPYTTPIHSHHLQTRAGIFHLSDETKLVPLRASRRCVEPLQIWDQSRRGGDFDGTDHFLMIQVDREVGNLFKKLFCPLHASSTRKFELQPFIQVFDAEKYAVDCGTVGMWDIRRSASCVPVISPSVISTRSREENALGVESSAQMTVAVLVMLDNDRGVTGLNDIFKSSCDLFRPLFPVSLDTSFHVPVMSDLMCWWLSRKAATAATLNVPPESVLV
ncbi:hypothetical protein F5146DRAFT_1035509 [Armillaria mellea]|nr:hypothetical protein F5146DRAFT_1035509 [Armillaria mellea]